jgi:hypothetical protein
MLNTTATANHTNQTDVKININLITVIMIVLSILILFIDAQNSAGQINAEFASNAGAALPASFLESHSEVEPAAYSTADTLTVLSAPDDRAQTISALSLHQGMMLLGRAAGSAWVKISLPGNVEGWVEAQYIRANVPVETLPFVW